ncbi:MAG: hypothetical protein QF464_18810, partial [Myxococcota bacterium]|nr:hypothetical protein [Myxococcota bacterium]
DSCDDANPCTTNDVCVIDTEAAEGVWCEGDPVDCDDGEWCTVDHCVDGGCEYEENDLACHDSNACSIDTCQPTNVAANTQGCVYESLVGPCDDDDPSTADSLCQLSGDEIVCAGGTQIVCESGPCIISATPNGVDCDYVYKSEAESCSDQDPCTESDRCDGAGSCVGEPVVCDDNNVCTADLCIAGEGCTYVPLTAGTPCDDGDDDPCTGGACAEANCVSIAEPLCEDRKLNRSATAGAQGSLVQLDNGSVLATWLGDERQSLHWRAMLASESLEGVEGAIWPSDLGLWEGWATFDGEVHDNVQNASNGVMVTGGQVALETVALEGGAFAIVAAEAANYYAFAGSHTFAGTGGEAGESICHTGAPICGADPDCDTSNPYCSDTLSEDVNGGAVGCVCQCNAVIKDVYATRIGQVTLTRFHPDGTPDGAPIRLLGQPPDHRRDRFSCDIDPPARVFQED